MIRDKRYLYNTAYSIEYQCYISITRVQQNEKGEFEFIGRNAIFGLENVTFKESELTKFCI